MDPFEDTEVSALHVICYLACEIQEYAQRKIETATRVGFGCRRYSDAT